MSFFLLLSHFLFNTIIKVFQLIRHIFHSFHYALRLTVLFVFFPLNGFATLAFNVDFGTDRLMLIKFLSYHVLMTPTTIYI